MKEGVGLDNVPLLIIGKWQENITTGSKWLMYSEVGPSVMIKKKTLTWKVRERYETDRTSKGCSQICNFTAEFQYSAKFNEMENITDQGSTLWFYESSQVTGKCDKWQEK